MIKWIMIVSFFIHSEPIPWSYQPMMFDTKQECQELGVEFLEGVKKRFGYNEAGRFDEPYRFAAIGINCKPIKVAPKGRSANGQ